MPDFNDVQSLYDLNSAEPQHSDAPEREEWDWDGISAALSECAHGWVKELLPRGRQDGDSWRTANIKGDPPRNRGSCEIQLRGERAGWWCDHAEVGSGGGPCGTVSAITGLHNAELWQMCKELCERHGHGFHSSTKARNDDNEKTARQEYAETEIRSRLLNAFPYRGTVAETYLVRRTGVAPECSDLMFHPIAHRSKREARGYPTMLARLRWPDGRLSGGLHQTFLRYDGSHHIGGDKPKMMLGQGLCIGATVMLASHNGTLGVGEGIETTLAGMRYFNVPGWAMLSAGGLKKLGEFLQESGGMIAAGPDQPLVKLQRLLIFADRGEGGEKNAWSLYRAARSVGVAVELYLPTGADDFCDDLTNGRPAPQPQPEPAESQQKGELPPRAGLPEIRLGGGRLPENIDDAERYLAQHDPRMFQRGGILVRPAKVVVSISHGRKIFALRLKRVGIQNLMDRLTRVVDFQKYNAKKNEWISTDCPGNIAAGLIERSGEWDNISHIRGIINAPTLRHDGSLLITPGYDPELCVLFDPGDTDFSAFTIPDVPTREQALLCLGMLCDLIREFPFVDKDGNDLKGKPSAERSVALSHILTGVIRRILERAPLHGFTATAAGSGKSLLVDTSAMISIGHECPVITQGGTEEETEKRLGAALLAGDTMISFDNCGRPLGSDILNQALTQSLIKVRILGTSDQPDMPSDALYSATGNGLSFVGDMGRRTLLSKLDPRMERPETRQFQTENPVKRVRRDRARYVAACLLVLRAYEVAGRPGRLKPLGSFEDWSDRVRSALVWLDQPDPVDTMEQVRESDPRRQQLAAVLHHWRAALGATEVTVKRIIETAATTRQGVDLNHVPFMHPDFREALLAVAGEGGAINTRRLGNWLRGVKGQVLEGMRIEQGPLLDGNTRWRLTAI